MEDLILTGNKYGTAGHSRSYVFANRETTVMYGINDGKGHQVLLTDEVYIQPEKNIWLDVTVFAEITDKALDSGYGGFVQVNAKINDTWYDLGNGGFGQLVKYDALPEVPRYSIRRYVDFDTVPDDLSAGGVSRVQIEVVLYPGEPFQRISLNPHTGVNASGKSSGSGASGTVIKEALDQNYTNVTITEISK
jgi:hypothetical protein